MRRGMWSSLSITCRHKVKDHNCEIFKVLIRSIGKCPGSKDDEAMLHE